MCEECGGNEVVYEFYVNHNKRAVASDWVYCKSCYPDSDGCFEAPWVIGYEIININQYNEFLKQGYRECN